jgi:hypothetical protein
VLRGDPLEPRRNAEIVSAPTMRWPSARTDHSSIVSSGGLTAVVHDACSIIAAAARAAASLVK